MLVQYVSYWRNHAPDQFAKLAIDPWPPCPIPRSQAPDGLAPARCQRRIVSGLTTWTVSSRLGHSRTIQTSNARSLPCNRMRGGFSVTPNLTNSLERGSRLQADYAT